MVSRLILGLALVICFCTVPLSALRAQPYGHDAVECVSHNFAYTRCDVPWHDARIVHQLSDTGCVRGQNWGVDRHGLWVDRGCAARFVEAGRGHAYAEAGWAPPPEWDHHFNVVCESQDYRYRFCGVDLGGGGRAFVRRKISGAECIEGRTWGWNRAGIWVDGGCAAEFEVDRRWH
jgi:hypothetical protein